MKVALTFDDGPSQWTDPILDLLTDSGAYATFFTVGANIPGRHETVLRIHEDGHDLGNHTTNHPDLTFLDREEIARELDETTLMLHAITEDAPRWWRAPYLRIPNVHTAGMRHVGCNVIPGDWSEPDPEAIVRRVLNDVRDGSIVLLHDGRPPNQRPHSEGGSLDSRDQVVAAVAQLLPALTDRGYECVAVASL